MVIDLPFLVGSLFGQELGKLSVHDQVKFNECHTITSIPSVILVSYKKDELELILPRVCYATIPRVYCALLLCLLQCPRYSRVYFDPGYSIRVASLPIAERTQG